MGLNDVRRDRSTGLWQVSPTVIVRLEDVQYMVLHSIEKKEKVSLCMVTGDVVEILGERARAFWGYMQNACLNKGAQE